MKQPDEPIGRVARSLQSGFLPVWVFYFIPPPHPLPLPSLSLPCAGGVVGSVGSQFPRLTGENSGKGELFLAHGCVGGPHAPLDPPPRSPAAAAAADRAPGERVSTAGAAPAPAGTRYLRIAPQAELRGSGRGQGQEGRRVAPPNFNQKGVGAAAVAPAGGCGGSRLRQSKTSAASHLFARRVGESRLGSVLEK